MYKLIALDLDETVLTSDRRVTAAVKQAIKRAEARGVKVVPCTGRSYRGAKAIIDDMGVAGVSIAFGGAMIVDHPGGEVHYAQTLDEPTVREIIDFANEQDVYLQIFQGQEYYFEREGYYSERYGRIQYKGIHTRFGDMALGGALKCLIADEARLQELYRLASERFSHVCSVVMSGLYFVELNQRGITKGNALKLLGEKLGIAREEMIAVGDSLIDLDMIEYAGLGVAVANAPQDIRAAADYIAPSNDQDGVAHVINKFILGE